MNGTTSLNGKNGHKVNTAAPKQWREATLCDIDPNPCNPTPNPTPTPCQPPCENNTKETTKETYFLMNTEKSTDKESGGISKLAQLLLGLATLLALGSLLSNLFLVWAISKTTNTNISKEVTTTTTTKEIIREADREADEHYYYAPAARW